MLGLPVFLQVEGVEQTADGQGGTLKPIICVDKNVDDLSTFTALVEESKQMQQEWSIVMTAALNGANGQYASGTITDKALDMMVRTVESGGDLSHYVAFDIEGAMVSFS